MAESNNEDTVVKVGSALGRVNYSAFVVLEDRLVGFNGDGDGCVGAGGLQSARAVRGNILIATVFEVI